MSKKKVNSLATFLLGDYTILPPRGSHNVSVVCLEDPTTIDLARQLEVSMMLLEEAVEEHGQEVKSVVIIPSKIYARISNSGMFSLSSISVQRQQ